MMKERTAKEAFEESANGRELTKIQQWRFNDTLEKAKKSVIHIAYRHIDMAVSQREFEAIFDLDRDSYYRPAGCLWSTNWEPACPRFFTNYEKDKLHEEVLEHLRFTFVRFGYEVKIGDSHRWEVGFHTESKRIEMKWSGKYGDACGES